MPSIWHHRFRHSRRQNCRNLDILLSYRIYTTQFDKDGKTWNRLRLGFFSTRQDAETVLEKLLPYFPGAWATPVSTEERADSADMDWMTGPGQ